MPTRNRRRRWDPRLLIGVAIVLASTAGMVGLVLSLERTTVAWAAPHDLVAGDVIRLGDLQPRPVRLDLVEGAYLVGDLDDELRLVALRPVGVGELVPVGALGTTDAIDTAVVVVPVDGPLASGLVAGATADVWAAAPDGATGFAAPVVIAPAATIGRVSAESGLVGGTAVSVELVVPRDRVARVLQALADGAAIALVPSLPGVDHTTTPATGEPATGP